MYVMAVVILTLLSISVVSYSSSSAAQVPEPSSACITYDSRENIITITCKTANLTDIDNQLRDPNILHKETTDNRYGRVIWLLNAA